MGDSALFKAFKVIGKHPQILVSDKEGALQGDEANAAYEAGMHTTYYYRLGAF